MFLAKNVFAVVVLYKTSIESSVAISTINNALRGEEYKLDILVYDNSPSQHDYIPEFKYENLNIQYFHDRSNGGLSKAYNYGANLIKNKNDKKWILVLDQDTAFNSNFFQKMKSAVDLYSDIRLFVPVLLNGSSILSPGQYKFKRGSRLKNILPGIHSLKNISPVNSGMLIYKEAFFEVGTYNEKVKLDFSDFQFIERFRKIYPSFCVVDSIGYQDFSGNETDTNKLNIRYSFFCEGAKNCDKPALIDYFLYLILTLRRAVSLSIRTKSLVFFKTFINYYVKKWDAEIRK